MGIRSSIGEMCVRVPNPMESELTLEISNDQKTTMDRSTLLSIREQIERLFYVLFEVYSDDFVGSATAIDTSGINLLVIKFVIGACVKRFPTEIHLSVF